MKVRPVEVRDRTEWLRMRSALWPHAASGHPREIDALLAGGTANGAVFVAESAPGGLCGLLEARMRDYADGCASSPVAYVEGWYVDPEVRRSGVGGALLAAAERWARDRGLTELASDSELGNEQARLAHRASGFEEVGRIVQFRKALAP